jgi:hypothetical protein
MSKEERIQIEEKKEEEKKEIIIIQYEPYTSWLCCTTYKDRSKFKTILQHLELSEVEKQIIESRYIAILENFQKRVRNHSIIYFMGHFMITVGSLFVPALLSIQNSDKSFTFQGDDFNVKIYWTTFIMSLLVTIWNGILTLFKIDKKYYFLNTALEKLRSEGWQFFGLTGRYSGHLTGGVKPTHKNQFMYFIHYIEKIKMKQVEEEYYKMDEKSSQAPTHTNQMNQNSNSNSSSSIPLSSNQDLYPPSPDKPIFSLVQSIPEPVKDAVNSLIVHSHKNNDSNITTTSTIPNHELIDMSLPTMSKETTNEIIIPIIEEKHSIDSSSTKKVNQPEVLSFKQLLHKSNEKIYSKKDVKENKDMNN